MRWLAWVGVGIVVATVGYVLLGLMVYDFDTATYHPEDSDRLIDEREFEGNRYWTRVGTWRFTGYEPGSILTWFAGWDHSRIYNRIEPAFRPLAWIARRCKAHAYRVESHDDESDDPGFFGCSRSHRWEVLEP